MNLPKALVLTVAATTFCLMTSPAFAVEETTPQNMTCQEFMDMNPKSMTSHTGTETRSRLLREAAVGNIAQWAQA